MKFNLLRSEAVIAGTMLTIDSLEIEPLDNVCEEVSDIAAEAIERMGLSTDLENVKEAAEWLFTAGVFLSDADDPDLGGLQAVGEAFEALTGIEMVDKSQNEKAWDVIKKRWFLEDAQNAAGIKTEEAVTDS